MTLRRSLVYVICSIVIVAATYGIYSLATDSPALDPSASANAPPSSENPLDLQYLVDDYLYNKSGLLGTIVHVDLRGEQSYRAAQGFFDISRTRPIRPRDMFLIGSITKLFTATLVHQLIERGEVKLDGQLIEYLAPEWAALLSQMEHGRDITVEQALSHRTGLFDAMNHQAFVTYVLPQPSLRASPLDLASLLLPQHTAALFRPGESFKYGNVNYHLLGALIEHVTRKPYATVLQNNILTPLALENTFLYEGPDGPRKEGIVHGYLQVDGKLCDIQSYHLTYAAAVGGLVSTTDDLITFLKALASGSLFERQTSFPQMCRVPKGSEKYALGIEVSDYPNMGLRYGHQGSTGNTSSIVAYFPEQDVAVSLCLTHDGSTARWSPSMLMEIIVWELLGLPYDGPGPGDILRYAELDLRVADVQEFSDYTIDGETFTAEQGRRLVRVRFEGTTSRTGFIQYAPSLVDLAYRVENQPATAECLALGQIFNTKTGIEEFWLSRDQAKVKTVEMSVEKVGKIVIYGLFELPASSRDLQVVAK